MAICLHADTLIHTQGADLVGVLFFQHFPSSKQYLRIYDCVFFSNFVGRNSNWNPNLIKKVWLLWRPVNGRGGKVKSLTFLPLLANFPWLFSRLLLHRLQTLVPLIHFGWFISFFPWLPADWFGCRRSRASWAKAGFVMVSFEAAELSSCHTSSLSKMNPANKEPLVVEQHLERSLPGKWDIDFPLFLALLFFHAGSFFFLPSSHSVPAPVTT